MKPVSIVLILYLIAGEASAELATGNAEKNALYQHASPYLAMHGRDPVRWQEWNAKTVALAKQQGKLLFVSSGYFSCHWCHVMQKESYQNTAIAKLLNEHFIPVKVDRELNSALDARLIDFVSRTQGISGWPLNAFVTPDGYPLVGMVYVPPDNFKTILEKLLAEWKNNPTALRDMARAASDELSPAKLSDSHQLPADFASQASKVFVEKLFSYSDELQGGFGQENKFPSVPQLATLLEIYSRQPDKRIKTFLTLTLDQMASQGLHDQLGGGFYRYVVDPGWQIPHFEKMLYDNALLTMLYFDAGEIFQRPDYTQVALDTANFMVTIMSTNTGALAASLSAVDDKGVEGGYYLWDSQQLQAILTKEELRVIEKFWQLDGPPDLDHGQHLVQTMSIEELAAALKKPQPQLEKILQSARSKMLQARSKRILPRDDKALAAWNGLALSALVRALRKTEDAKIKDAANALAGFIENTLWNGTQLHGAYARGKSLGKANLEDYAYTTQGLFDWWQFTRADRTKQRLEKMINQAWQRFYGKQGWILAEDMLLRYGQGEAVIADGPMPSPSALLVRITWQYAMATGDENLRKQALRALNHNRQEVLIDPFWFATQIKTIIEVQQPG